MTTQEIVKSRVEQGLQFTESYFLEEINRFREACGTKTFWAKTDEQQQTMISGLTFCYLNIVNKDGSYPNHEQIKKWAFIFEQALENYARRKAYTIMLPLKQSIGLV